MPSPRKLTNLVHNVLPKFDNDFMEKHWGKDRYRVNNHPTFSDYPTYAQIIDIRFASEIQNEKSYCRILERVFGLKDVCYEGNDGEIFGFLNPNWVETFYPKELFQKFATNDGEVIIFYTAIRKRVTVQIEVDIGIELNAYKEMEDDLNDLSHNLCIPIINESENGELDLLDDLMWHDAIKFSDPLQIRHCVKGTTELTSWKHPHRSSISDTD